MRVTLPGSHLVGEVVGYLVVGGVVAVVSSWVPSWSPSVFLLLFARVLSSVCFVALGQVVVECFAWVSVFDLQFGFASFFWALLYLCPVGLRVFIDLPDFVCQLRHFGGPKLEIVQCLSQC